MYGRKMLIGWLFVVLLTAANADPLTSADKLHAYLSKKVLDASVYWDDTISRWLGYDESKLCAKKKKTPTFKKENEKDIDSFFFNNKYLNDTDDIYIRLRLKARLNSRYSDKFNASLSAQLPFDKCRTQWKIFLQDINRESSEVKSTDSFSGGVGIRYDDRERWGIDSSYSLGLYGGAPYIRARFKKPFLYQKWRIEPVQIFKYSTKYNFEEESNIYFDHFIAEETLFRLQLHRKTATKIRGMDYGLIVQMYRYLGKNAGFEFSQSFFGNTYYNRFYAFDDNYSGINNFVTSIGWRATLWRKWLYYEIRPTVNYHKDNRYHPTYSLRFYLDIYFGKYD